MCTHTLEAKIDDKKINYEIRFPEVRLIDAEGKPLGVKNTNEAISLAKTQELDLVLVAEKAQPPVAKIMDYGKFKYEQEKALKKQKASQKEIQLKEVRLSPNISRHDLSIRIERTKKFLAEGDMVKLSLRIFGRNLQYAQEKQKIIEAVLEEIKENGKLEGYIKKEGNMFQAIIKPIK